MQLVFLSTDDKLIYWTCQSLDILKNTIIYKKKKIKKEQKLLTLFSFFCFFVNNHAHAIGSCWAPVLRGGEGTIVLMDWKNK